MVANCAHDKLVKDTELIAVSTSIHNINHKILHLVA
jgi:hypothetical protein